MDLPERKRLPHDVPLWIDPQKEVYFLTINCQPKGLNHFAKPEIAEALLKSVCIRNENFTWFAYLFLVMPDHVHALMSFPTSPKTFKETVRFWKRWTAR
jgi:putative transposase